MTTTNRQLRDAAKLAGGRFFTPVKPCGKCGCNLYYASVGYSGACRDCTNAASEKNNSKRPNKSGRTVAMATCTCPHCLHDQTKRRSTTTQQCLKCGKDFQSVQRVRKPRKGKVTDTCKLAELAQAAGIKYFQSEKPCTTCNGLLRYASNTACVECRRQQDSNTRRNLPVRRKRRYFECPVCNHEQRRPHLDVFCKCLCCETTLNVKNIKGYLLDAS